MWQGRNIKEGKHNRSKWGYRNKLVLGRHFQLFNGEEYIIFQKLEIVMLLLMILLSWPPFSPVMAALVEVKPGVIGSTTSSGMWQKTDDGDLKYLEEACRYCESLTLGGYEDWQLGVLSVSNLLDSQKAEPPYIDPIFDCHNYHYWDWTYYGPSRIPNGDDLWVDGAHFGLNYEWIDLQANNYHPSWTVIESGTS